MSLIKKLFLSTAFISLLVPHAFADSSVFFDQGNGAYGYSYNSHGMKPARDLALYYCKKSGGKNCKEFLTSGKRGYGAVAYADTKTGKHVIGVVLSASTQEKASKEAIEKCKKAGGIDPKIDGTFRDTYLF
jgi:hypothetical protein